MPFEMKQPRDCADGDVIVREKPSRRSRFSRGTGGCKKRPASIPL